MPAKFQPHPDKDADILGSFSVYNFFRESINHGPLHFMTLVPHVLIPIYGVYRLLKQSGYWTSNVDYLVDALLIPLLQGLSLGGILGTTTLRYLSPTGRRIASKRAESSATDGEDKSQHRLELALWSFIYLGFAT
ncbi:hypothetical protein CBS101457_004360 [Exobasidium rhododendri]|nr:hypothetical protein CBS101457_004360 [Exobasidium rhododendri]